MWDLPGPGLEPVSAALAGGFLTTALPGKSPRTPWFSALLCLLVKEQTVLPCMGVAGSETTLVCRSLGCLPSAFALHQLSLPSFQEG